MISIQLINGLIETVIESSDFEVDECLLRFKRPEIVLEVKWEKIKSKDVLKIKKRLKK